MLTIEQAHWLIDFMRNLPGSRGGEVTSGEYERSWNVQRAEAHRLQNAQSPFPDERSGYVDERAGYFDDYGDRRLSDYED